MRTKKTRAPRADFYWSAEREKRLRELMTLLKTTNRSAAVVSAIEDSLALRGGDLLAILTRLGVELRDVSVASVEGRWRISSAAEQIAHLCPGDQFEEVWVRVGQLCPNGCGWRASWDTVDQAGRVLKFEHE